jgi:hypothetical protein
MPTYDLVFNIAKGRVAELALLAAANDALIAIPIEASGIVSAATMRDYDDVATLLAGASNEATTGGWSRKTLTGVTSTTNDTDDCRYVDFDDITWTAVTGNPVAALLIAYDPDTTGGTDSSLVPLLLLDFVATPAGGDIAYQVAANGAFKAA